ncbi:MAG: fibronectin/fibrinogen-binding protein [Ruminococcaceae bacterium]|nr:fibronectin/fibrinogen-binding protein [Oscillospiraceae bacterium]MBQ3214691.1 NFACT family protein [Oscillospiraceae bacterium]
MAFDAFYLSAVLEEIRSLGEARVEKIHQPSRDTVVLHLRGRESRAKLLINPNPAAPRLHLTQTNPENPPEPPMFCMLLRKHLSGARLVKITQPAMERAATFVFDCIDELGDPVQKRLVAELMGRTCNLYLLGGDGRIIDCLRRIGLDETSKRPALPGLHYQDPEPVEKIHPLEADIEQLLRQAGADILSDRLMDTLGGLSPLVCREAALFAMGDTGARLEDANISAVAEKLGLFFHEHLTHPAPYYYNVGDTPKQFAFCPIRQYGQCQQGESFSGLLDSFYSTRDRKDAMRQKSQAVRKTVTNLCQRLTRKLAIQDKELAATYDRERLRQLGDILTANLHRITKGQTAVEVEDFYDENMKTIEIPLSPLLSPQQNAAKYYKDYTRMKNAEKELKHQMALAREELEYLQSVREELDRAATEQELEEIRQELQAGGYVKADTGKRKMKQSKLPPMRFESTDGYPIYVGRNNRQNDELTFKLARKDDIWLHASKVHGSHVIISCGGATPPDDTVTQAAQLAAYYSESGGGQNIPVDVTPVKQVKRVPSAKPGMVIYHTYRTVIANPYKDIVVDELNVEKKVSLD